MILTFSSINVFATDGFTSTPLYPQQKSNWCWAASVEMLLKTQNRNYPSQPEIVTNLYDSPIDYGASISQAELAAEKSSGGNLNYDVYAYPFSYDKVISSINAGWPVYASCNGHAMVITGYRTTVNLVWLQDPQGKTLSVFPAPGYENWCDYSYLINGKFSSTSYFTYLSGYGFYWVASMH